MKHRSIQWHSIYLCNLVASFITLQPKLGPCIISLSLQSTRRRKSMSNLEKIRLIDKSNLKEGHHTIEWLKAMTLAALCTVKYYPASDKNFNRWFLMNEPAVYQSSSDKPWGNILISKKRGTPLENNHVLTYKKQV